MIRLKGGRRKTLQTFLQWQNEELAPEQQNNDTQTLLTNSLKEITFALKEVTLKPSTSLDKIVHEEKNKENTIGETLAKAYTWLEKHFHYTGPALHYQESSSQPHYVRDKKKAEHSLSDNKNPDLHSPAIRNEILAQKIVVAEQVHARQQQDYGKALVTKTLSLEEKESTYWWRITHQALKEFMYATADKAIWN